MKVTVTKNQKTGKVFTQNANVSEKDGKQYGYYIVSGISTSFENGFMKASKRSALIATEEETFKMVGYSEGQELTGKIWRKESLVEFLGSREVVNPQTGEIVTRNGKVLYRRDIFTTDLTKQDELVTINSIVEVKETASLAK